MEPRSDSRIEKASKALSEAQSKFVDRLVGDGNRMLAPHLVLALYADAIGLPERAPRSRRLPY